MRKFHLVKRRGLSPGKRIEVASPFEIEPDQGKPGNQLSGRQIIQNPWSELLLQISSDIN